MTTRTLRARWPLLLILALAACARDPEARALGYAERADAYAAQGKYDEAIIEYGNALKATPNAADLRYKRGRAYESTGELVRAYADFARAGDLDPANVDAQMRAGTLLLAAREFGLARARAELALEADPSHVPAHILLGNAMAGLNEFGPALRQIQQAIDLDPSSAPAWTALGAVTFVGGRRAEAEEAFRKAVSLAPSSVDARLALANYEWASGRIEAAEGTLKQALALEPDHDGAHRALALLYITNKRAAEAERHMQALAGSPAGQLALADYYMGVGRNAEALTVIGELERSAERSDARAARLRRAAILYGGGRREEAHGIMDALLEERPRHAETRTAKARMLLSEGSNDDALVHAREAVKADPELPAAHYTLGLAALGANQLQEAEQAFEEVIRISPRAAAARTQLARIRLARGETSRAVSAAELAVREQPDDVEAAVLLSRGLRTQGDLDRAERELKTKLAAQPTAPALHLEMGWVALQRRDHNVARLSFAEALHLAPGLFDARNGLVTADLLDGDTAAARARVAEWQADDPADSSLRVLGARVELAAGNLPAAEATLEAVIAADPSQLDAYDALGRTYLAQGRAADAIRQYDALAGRSPTAAAGAKTMVGLLHEANKEPAAAQAAYEQALAADPRAGVAANNLAWIYANSGRLDDALRLATVARDSLRRRPEAEDTLGWVYLQKGLAGEALAAFTRARDLAPQNPVYHYHLGLAHTSLGDASRAQASFERALALRTDYPDATAALARLKAGPR
jgi:putative PEP-CTERM system TPR-repeat lipoprotein